MIGRDIPDEALQVVEVESKLVSSITGQPSINLPGSPAPTPLFQTQEERQIAAKVLQAMETLGRMSKISDFSSPEIQQQLTERVAAEIRPSQPELEGIVQSPDFAAIIARTAQAVVDLSIDIPKIIVTPSDDYTFRFLHFELDTSNMRQQPVAHDILVQHLHDQQRYRIGGGNGIVPEARPENYLVRGLVDYNDVNYQDCAKLLYNLAGQVVHHLRRYLATEDDVINVLQYHGGTLVEQIYSQMQMEEHFEETATSYTAHVHPGFSRLRPGTFALPAGAVLRDFRDTVDEKLLIKGMLFSGFKKCLYDAQRFDSDSERRFSILLEDDPDVLKWLKPTKKVFEIDYRNGEIYEPDFIVETKTGRWICEPKRASEMADETVLAKAKPPLPGANTPRPPPTPLGPTCLSHTIASEQTQRSLD